MTSADTSAARDHTSDAIALVRLLNAGRTTDAQQLLGCYTTSADQSGLTGTMAMLATTLAAYVDRIAHDMAALKPGYPVGKSADVLAQFEAFMKPADNGGASGEPTRGEPISYL